VANTGATTLEIQLVNFAEPLAAPDFNL